MKRPSYFKSDTSPPIQDCTIGELLRKVAAEVPDRVALSEPSSSDGRPGRKWSYAQLLRAAESLGRALSSRFASGEHIALWAANSPEWIIAEYAAAMAGLVVVAVNPSYLQDEALYVLGHSEAVGVIFSSSYRDIDIRGMLDTLQPALPLLRERIPIEELAALMDGEPAPAPTAASPDAPAMIQYTSGTTGKPKGAVLSHRGILNTSYFSARNLELSKPPVWYLAVPLFHTSGCGLVVLGTLWNQGTVVVAPAFDGARTLDAIRNDKVSCANLVPTMVLRLLEVLEADPGPVDSLEVIICGGSVVPPELVRRMERELGCDCVIVFGQTETSCVVTQTDRRDSLANRTTTIGHLTPHLEARIVDASNKVVEMGDAGEIQVRGYMAMIGYHRAPEATAATLDPEGWLHTGDIGTLRADGYLTISGRIKDLVNRGGEKIYPREIEDVLATHQQIIAGVVFPVPDPLWGEVPVAAVLLKPGVVQDAVSLESWLRSRLASHKVPRQYMFVDALPLTPSGKIKKFELRKQFLERVGSGGLPG